MQQFQCDDPVHRIKTEPEDDYESAEGSVPEHPVRVSFGIYAYAGMNAYYVVHFIFECVDGLYDGWKGHVCIQSYVYLYARVYVLSLCCVRVCLCLCVFTLPCVVRLFSCINIMCVLR